MEKPLRILAAKRQWAMDRNKSRLVTFEWAKSVAKKRQNDNNKKGTFERSWHVLCVSHDAYIWWDRRATYKYIFLQYNTRMNGKNYEYRDHGWLLMLSHFSFLLAFLVFPWCLGTCCDTVKASANIAKMKQAGTHAHMLAFTWATGQPNIKRWTKN